MQSSFFETFDRNHALEHVRTMHDLDIRSAHAGPFHLRQRQVDYGEWNSHVAQFEAGGFDTAPGKEVVVCWMKSGWLELSTGRDTLTVQRGEIVVLADAAHPHSTRFTDAELHAVGVPVSLLERVAHNSVAVPDRTQFSLLGRRPVTTQAGQRLAQGLRFAQRHVVDSESAPEQVTLDAVGHVIAATLLATFPNTLVAESSPLQPRTDVPRTVALAQDFIARNADLPITPAHIARYACVSKRALEMAFREHLSLSPTVYLRLYRLSRIHAELKRATPGDGTSVTQVAVRWGFPEPSRFGAHYRAVYGQTPSTTLRETD